MGIILYMHHASTLNDLLSNCIILQSIFHCALQFGPSVFYQLLIKLMRLCMFVSESKYRTVVNYYLMYFEKEGKNRKITTQWLHDWSLSMLIPQNLISSSIL